MFLDVSKIAPPQMDREITKSKRTAVTNSSVYSEIHRFREKQIIQKN